MLGLGNKPKYNWFHSLLFRQISFSLFICLDQVSSLWVCVYLHSFSGSQTPAEGGCQATLPFLGLSRHVCVFVGSHPLCVKQQTRTCLPQPADIVARTLLSHVTPPSCLLLHFRSSYLVAGEDERCPYKEARHSLRSGSHEEDGLVWAEQRGFGEPWHVGACRSNCGRQAGCHGQRHILPQPLWEWHISPPQPQHLRRTENTETVNTEEGTQQLVWVLLCLHMETPETQTITTLWCNSLSMSVHLHWRSSTWNIDHTVPSV